MPLSAGDKLGPYEILAIGAGGMGEVYRARDSRQERDQGALLYVLDGSLFRENSAGKLGPRWIRKLLSQR